MHTGKTTLLPAADMKAPWEIFQGSAGYKVSSLLSVELTSVWTHRPSLCVSLLGPWGSTPPLYLTELDEVRRDSVGLGSHRAFPVRFRSDCSLSPPPPSVSTHLHNPYTPQGLQVRVRRSSPSSPGVSRFSSAPVKPHTETLEAEAEDLGAWLSSVLHGRPGKV